MKELNTFKKTFFFNVILEWLSEWERVNYSIVQTVINVLCKSFLSVIDESSVVVVVYLTVGLFRLFELSNQ